MGRPQKIGTLELVDIAREVLIQHGVPGAPKKIAKKARISEAAVFQRFKNSKRELLHAALAPPAYKADEIIGQPSTEEDPKEALAATADRLLAYFRQALPRLLPLLGEPSARRQILLKALGRNPALTLRVPLELYLQAQFKLGRLSKVDMEAAATLLVFALYCIALMEEIQGRAMPKPAARALVDVLWRGLRPEEKTARKSRKPELPALPLRHEQHGA